MCEMRKMHFSEAIWDSISRFDANQMIIMILMMIMMMMIMIFRLHRTLIRIV